MNRRVATRPDPERVLAIMAKAPRAGHVKTRLTSSYPAGYVLSLYRALVEDSLSLARRLSLTIAVVCPHGDERALADWLPSDVRIVPQRGSGLADGLTSCFDALCQAPVRRVVAFNSDSPHLAPEILERAFASLANTDLVIGPSGDGGYYLVGVTTSHAGLFDPAGMGTGMALDTLLANARRLNLSFTYTPEHYDVDLPDDVARLARELSANPSAAPRTASVLAAWPHHSAPSRADV